MLLVTKFVLVVFRSAVSNHEMKRIIKFAVAFQAFLICSVYTFPFSISVILHAFGFEAYDIYEYFFA